MSRWRIYLTFLKQTTRQQQGGILDALEIWWNTNGTIWSRPGGCSSHGPKRRRRHGASPTLRRLKRICQDEWDEPPKSRCEKTSRGSRRSKSLSNSTLFIICLSASGDRWDFKWSLTNGWLVSLRRRPAADSRLLPAGPRPHTRDLLQRSCRLHKDSGRTALLVLYRLPALTHVIEIIVCALVFQPVAR